MWKRNIKANLKIKDKIMKSFLKIFILLFDMFLLFQSRKSSFDYSLLLFPNNKKFRKESLNIGKNAYQLLYFGKYEDSLNLAKLAVKINAKNEQLWLILSEAQLANNLYKKALDSLKKAQI